MAQLTVATEAGNPSKTLKVVAKETIGSGYFDTLSEPMLAGREFTERDQRIELPAVLPVVLNETAARALFGTGNEIGRRVTEDKQLYEVVGVVRDLKNGIPDDDQPASVMYLPLTRRDFASPPPGGVLRYLTVVNPCVPSNRPDALRAILLAAYNELRGKDYAFITIGLDVKDPLTAALKGLMTQPMLVNGYVSSPSGAYRGPALDQRPFHFEIALV